MNFVVAFSPEFSKSLALLVKLGLARRDEVNVPGGKVVPYELLVRLVDMLPRAGRGGGRIRLWCEEGRAPRREEWG